MTIKNFSPVRQKIPSYGQKLMPKYGIIGGILGTIISMVLLRIPTAVQPMTGIEGFRYQASDG